jgi:lipopolysaccharide biosynthesis protein/2-polyprenyl-3-methyl-5-hydroxy-6-metoxy-1,4-benzoquinol methylase
MDEIRLKPDGERFLPQFRGVIELEHYHRYFLAAEVTRAKDVLDIASGEGFGSEILSRQAKSVVGVDIAQEAVAHAANCYVRSNLRFLHGSALDIPLPDRSVDVIVSFETIEHLAEHDAMMTELKRVLRTDGCLIISSPNKLVYTDRSNYTNPFHVRELYTADFIRLSSRYFKNTRHYGQRVTTGSVIAGTAASGAFTTFAPGDAAHGMPEQMYDIILASDAALPELGASVFEQPHGLMQPKRIEALILEASGKGAEVERLEQELAQAVAAKGSEVARLEGTVAATQQQLASLQNALYRALQDGQKVVQDKWWRRTRGLRKLSNSLKKRRGKQPKTWPTSFEAERYLSDAEPVGQLSQEDPVSALDGYDSSIARVVYSDVSESFVPYEPAPPMETILRTIAFYLPQFHPFAENDAWWGKGFTEWTNVGKALPLFRGHHQPHCPIHFGYYDLRVPEVMEEQARLARQYGISGFAYYFYWFAGKVLMELPLKQMLHNPKVDIPFCMIWANETWSRRWDGAEKDILIAQRHSLEDSRAMLDYLRPFMHDPRYIKVDGKPLFILYRADIIPDIKGTVAAWRAQAVSFGFPGLYVVCAQTFGHRDPRGFGCDAAMEFPPHTVVSSNVAARIPGLDPLFSGAIYSYDQVVTNAVKREDNDYKVFPTAMLSWDNTARRRRNSVVFADFSTIRYSQWLSSNAERVLSDPRLAPSEHIVFVNAWNEWAEGSHLEPDQKYGYAYLAATSSVLKNYSKNSVKFKLPNIPAQARSEVAVIAHLHYATTWLDVKQAIQNILAWSPDVYVSVTTLQLAELVLADFPDAIIEIVDNRGRDIRPFLRTFKRIQSLGYNAIAKVHGKASVYRSDGDLLRRASLQSVLSEASLKFFLDDANLGLLSPAGDLIAHDDRNMFHNAVHTDRLARELGFDFRRGKFPAGSMFWFRPDALAPLLRLSVHDFDVERGLADGTRAHAIERLFCSICEHSGYTVGTL